MSNKKTSKSKKNKQIKMDRDEIRKGYAKYFRNKRLVLAGETFRSRKKTGPEKAPSHYRSRF